MRNSETGEFELVMGNRQLLSGFFIVALLFGVAFAMGYIVGRNSSPAGKAQAESAGAPVMDQRPAANGSRLETPPADPPRSEASAPEPQATAPAAAPVSTAPAQAAPEPPQRPAPGEPGAGSYWQVAAVKQPDADLVVRTLRDKGFPATLSPGPNNLMRVLVGPYRDRESLGKAKADLENAGFPTVLKK